MEPQQGIYKFRSFLYLIAPDKDGELIVENPNGPLEIRPYHFIGYESDYLTKDETQELIEQTQDENEKKLLKRGLELLTNQHLTSPTDDFMKRYRNPNHSQSSPKCTENNPKYLTREEMSGEEQMLNSLYGAKISKKPQIDDKKG